MALPEFTYLRPGTLDEALSMAAAHSGDAKFLAGGQTLIPILSMRLARPAALIDLGRLAELEYIRIEDGELRIGALTRHRAVAENEEVRAACPLLTAAVSQIGHAHIRNRGTLGGSVAHADPSAEYPLAITVLGGRIEMASAEGRRSLPAGEFFLGPLFSALGPEELVTGVAIPLPDPRAGWSFREMVQRSGDFALVSVAVLLKLEDGLVQEVAIGVGGATSIPMRMAAAEAALVGRAPTVEVIREAAAAAAAEVDPTDDIHASAEYRRNIARVMVRDALLEAVGRVGA